jgi:hypothetical protein
MYMDTQDSNDLTQAPVIYGLDVIGLFGPIIIFIIGLWQLWGNGIYWSISIVLFIVNMMINKILKQWIREPRPIGGQSMFTFEQYSGIEQYGMPSGHAQSIISSVTYLYLVKNSFAWLIGGIFISALTIYQRWKYRRHSVEQLGIGATIGFLVAYTGYTITTKGLIGELE